MRRRSGIGSALLASRLQQVDTEGAAAYLEASTPAHTLYYGRFGFEETGVVPVPSDAPVIPTMWRSAKDRQHGLASEVES